MMQFRCGECGSRIAVAKRHLERLCQCPECGGVTHPLAEQLETGRRCCENCGDKIGRLQKLRRFRNHIVCNECHAALSEPPIERTPVAIAQMIPAARATEITSPNAEPVVVRTRPSLEESPIHTAAAGQVVNDLHAGALGVLVGFGILTAAFLLAMTVLSYIGLFVTVLVFGFLLVLGIQRLWRGTAMLRTRALDFKLIRSEQGTGKMALALAGSFRTRRPVAAAMGLVALLICAAFFSVLSMSGFAMRMVARR